VSSLHFEHSALRLHFEYSIFTKSLHFLHRNFVFSTLQPASTRYLQSGCCRESYVSALLLTLLGLVVQRVRGARAVLLCRGRCQCTFCTALTGVVARSAVTCAAVHSPYIRLVGLIRQRCFGRFLSKTTLNVMTVHVH